MKLLKKGLLLAAAAILAVGIAGCGGEKEKAPAGNVLKVATNATYVPFEFKDKDGKD